MLWKQEIDHAQRKDVRSSVMILGSCARGPSSILLPHFFELFFVCRLPLDIHILGSLIFLSNFLGSKFAQVLWDGCTQFQNTFDYC
jgi:hypothetical protein